MNNINSRQRKNITMGKSSTRNLMKRMHSEFGLSIYELKALSSTTTNLEDIDDDQLRSVLKKCQKKGHCEELRGIIKNQGVNGFITKVKFYNPYKKGTGYIFYDHVRLRGGGAKTKD